MQQLKIISFTHKRIDLKCLGKLVICEEGLGSRLEALKAGMGVSEVFYVATCNRVEFIFLCEGLLDNAYVRRFMDTLDMGLPEEFMERFLEGVEVYENKAALLHLLRTSCSLESLVVGEKEILAQIRKAYDYCKAAGFTGDKLRIIVECMVKTAKEVYTYTNISKNPVSVVSLAYRKLKELDLCRDARVLIIGAGETNQNLAKYLAKHKFSNFTVYNRTESKATALAAELGGTGYALDKLPAHCTGFDAIITCTGSTAPIITPGLYAKLLNNEGGRKVIVDLAVPNDTSADVMLQYDVEYIEVQSLKDIARKNIQQRYAELVHAERIIDENIQQFENILKQRRIELAMKDVPSKIKEIKQTAVNGIFADDINKLDADSRAVLEKVLNYMEKKYISVPMVMAKQILTEQ